MTKQKLIFVHEDGNYRVNGGYLCSLPKKNKVVTIKNYSVGIGHSAHPNIDPSGSVRGIIKLEYWKKTDIIVRQGGFIYNVTKVYCSDILDELCLAIEENRCKADFAGLVFTYTFETEKSYA